MCVSAGVSECVCVRACSYVARSPPVSERLELKHAGSANRQHTSAYLSIPRLKHVDVAN